MESTNSQDDATPTERFGRAMTEILNNAALALMISIGHRTGLFDAMDGLPPSTSEGVALASGLNERYVREWLGTMVVGDVVAFDPITNLYHLPEEHAAWLTRSTMLVNAAASAHWIAVLGGVESLVVDASRHGQGAPYSAYSRFHEVMAEESQQTVVSALLEHILPLVPGLMERLERGIDVLDVGCGRGRALMTMAEAYPASRFLGVDLSEEALADTRASAESRGLKNIRFEARDAAALGPQQAFDFVTAFDEIHDQARSSATSRNRFAPTASS